MITCWILLIMRNVSDKFIEKIKTHILCRIIFFRKLYRLWDNMETFSTVWPVTDDNMAYVHCITDIHVGYVFKATNRICHTYSFSSVTIFARRRLNVMLHYTTLHYTTLHHTTLPVLFWSLKLISCHATPRSLVEARICRFHNQNSWSSDQ
jgi:hypothetical protein